MPSGAKRRKAAKKKKEKEANINNPSTDNPQGNDDSKSQDEKGSDGAEVNSPAYRDQDDHHRPFNEGDEEVEERDPSVAQPSNADLKSVIEIPTDIKSAEVVEEKDDRGVNIERYLRSEESYDCQNISVEHIESAKQSHEGDRNSSSTSYDESLTEKNWKEEPYNSIQETIASEDLVKSVEPFPVQKTLITENAPVEETSNFVGESSVDSVKAVDSLSEVKCNDTGSSLIEKSVVPQAEATNLSTKKNDDKVYLLSDKYVKTPSLEEPEPKEYDGKVSASLSGGHFTESTKDTEHIKDSDKPESSVDQEPLVASTPHLVQKTCWLSCCGLFDVLSGSNR
ncbi:hypothetical protein L6164_031791 [Bauhinia variegata]|uniref:Uncharacterized protein n=1 Tax=Bauhinia variegata TaxID=167791 RepID=A0ACB9KLL7_BAUVA|nr:hypothetical protein L6164_031791 [Bauhinia variegata]